MYARALPVQTKVHFKNLLFLAVTCDMGFLSCLNGSVFSFKQFLETEMILESTNHCTRMRTYVQRRVKW